MLQQEPPTRYQVGGRGAYDFPDGVEAIASSDERVLRLVAQRFQVRVPGGDVRRVRDNQVKTLAGQRLEPPTVAEFDREVVARCVALRHHQGGGACFHRYDPGARALPLERKRDGATAGAEIDDGRKRLLQRQLDQDTTFPMRSVSVTIVLLNVAWM